ncbi:MAG: hypothetical protein ATN36_07690 [Epulopiscium sp. Nele67-Bin005]|nr:MAG: hypothetical protein ATN36_07690 [Epulopiscium sp. Nele67-Bin005]
MEVAWSYNLIKLLYVILIVAKILNIYIIKNIENNHDVKKFNIYKKDFAVLIAFGCLVCAIIINIMIFVGGTPFNQDIVVITVLMLGIAFLSSRSSVLMGEQTYLNVGGYTVEPQLIKNVDSKKRGFYTIFTLNYAEEIHGYKKQVLYYTGQDETSFLEQINEMIQLSSNTTDDGEIE